MSAEKRIYVTSRGYFPNDIVNWSIPVKPDTTDAQADELMDSLLHIQTGNIVYGWTKPKKKSIEGLRAVFRQDALSLLRWTIWWSNSGLYHNYWGSAPHEWRKYSDQAYVSIPFADPQLSKYIVKRDISKIDDPNWLRLFELFAKHVWVDTYRRQAKPNPDKPSQITSVTFKVSFPTRFVKNII